MANQETALRKRQQIAKANRTMFLWVAGISALVGIAVVGSIFLFQKASFNERVLGIKAKTAETLRTNNEVVPKLEDEVRAMNTNQALKDAMAPNQTQPIRVVLDALPSDGNSSALGASLQEKFLTDPALRIESLNVDPIVGIESTTSENVQDASVVADDSVSSNVITFKFSVSTDLNNVNALKTVLLKLERSIRAFDIQTLRIETQSNRIILTAEGRAYYEPAQTAELKDETVKPNEKN